jgi:alkanesulfonate monooxygenase SsuD/methylene tetrahydromethanopterin reductase-like flavin-dependent oxidoreductase (luciferase family)
MAIARDPILTAKEVASLDRLSGGRFIFGIGYGWNAEEIEDHGVPFSSRADVLRDKIMAMKAIWSNDEGSFDGTYVSFGPTWSWPKPLQLPQPPIVMGCRTSDDNFRDISADCDGWMPIEYFRKTIEMLPKLHQTCYSAALRPGQRLGNAPVRLHVITRPLRRTMA